MRWINNSRRGLCAIVIAAMALAGCAEKQATPPWVQEIVADQSGSEAQKKAWTELFTTLANQGIVRSKAEAIPVAMTCMKYISIFGQGGDPTASQIVSYLKDDLNLPIDSEQGERVKPLFDRACSSGGNSADSSRSSETTSKVKPGPKSDILPAVVLPAGSRKDKSDTLEGGVLREGWVLELPFDEASEYLKTNLPIGDHFDEARYDGDESGMTKDGAKEIRWTWLKEPDKFIEIHLRQIGGASAVVIAYLPGS